MIEGALSVDGKSAQTEATWSVEFLRAMRWSGPHICGSFLASQPFDRPLRSWVLYGLLLGLVPLTLAAANRSWRLGVASFTVAATVLALAYAAVWMLIKAIV